ncbi:MAG: DUF6402 family protein [Polaribacter sp.]
MTLPFEQDKVNLFFDIDAGDAVAYYVNIHAKDKSNNGSKKKVYTSKKYPLANGKNHYWIVMDYMFYNRTAKNVATSGKSLPNQIEFFFELEVEISSNNQCSVEKEELNETLTLHFVRYIPKLLNILGFSNGEYLQRLWFTLGKNIDKKTVDPQLDAVEWDWAVSESSQVRGEYNDFLIETGTMLNNNIHLFGNNVRDSLKSEINKMINDGLVLLPTKNGPDQPFGVLDSQIVTYKGQKMPKFEKYYFESKPFSGIFDLGVHYTFDGLDDFIAALANFNYHMLAIGMLKYNTNGWLTDTIDINVKQLGVYIKDNFDFIDDDPNEDSQPLGYWKIINENEVEVERKISEKPKYFEVTNESYRDYRDDHNMGYNYHLYSTIELKNVDYKVKLKDA